MKNAALAKPLAPFPHRCTKCGKVYSLKAWRALPHKGHMEVPAGEGEPAYALDHRDCDAPKCFGTMSHPFEVYPEPKR